VARSTDLGGYSSSSNNVLGTYSIGGCWCVQSYFAGPDGAAVGSSGGQNVILWHLQTSPSPALVKVFESPALGGTQNPRFFTTISSNGKKDSIIWALSHPLNTTGSPLTLYAFGLKTTGIETLFNGTAGAWSNVGGNSNLVP
jgi:hypothetical protein